ncbi:histone methylation protein DOT1-domain-containing protein [Leucosporidium creatinivorum]|uniref:Histone-lysine N-methyltransferase, H3 lysine-79 specific n=1 Tax=Leucosporidium creatinivorum TaxID=106004 RepID=A0A1Y2D5P0_9BASI|nr:histone methylation protein DOT1-domain-containing protein [Leucosporidium creatinivorum]
MFSSKKRTTATTTITTTTRPAASTSSGTARPPVKVATRTIVSVRKVPAPAAPSPRPQPPQVNKRPAPPPPPSSPRVNALKRKPEAPVKSKQQQPTKSSKSEGKKVARKVVVESSSEEGSGSSSSGGEEAADSDSSEDGTPMLGRRKEVTPCVERNVAATLDGKVECITGESLVMDSRKAYVDWFVDLSAPKKPASEWAGSEIPTIDLEYPGKDAKERFVLLTPRNEDEYDPIEDVMTTIRMVLDNFLTPAQSLALFAHVPASDSFASFLSAPTSRSATPSTPTDSGPAAMPITPLMRSLEKAKAKKDGPTFLSEIERYNSVIRTLREEGKMEENIKAMKGLKQKTWEKVAAQAYDRAVGPEIEELARYEAFSDNVYGELLPKFMGEIFQATGLGPNSVFVDLGSGVGNCVVQAALATGCEAWGFENMAHASSLARRQVVEAEARFRLWGLNSGKMSTVEADFCEHPLVGEVLKRADVILVNNEVFTSSLNERLSLLFLDLPDSTRIVSLKAFASSFTLSAHNRHSPLAILRQGPELRYPRNSVSWKSEAGTYFIGKVDRGLLQKFDEREAKRAAKRAQREAADKAK